MPLPAPTKFWIVVGGTSGVNGGSQRFTNPSSAVAAAEALANANPRELYYVLEAITAYRAIVEAPVEYDLTPS